MSIVVSHQIRKKEFGSTIPDDARDVIIRSARVSLATPIPIKGLPAKTRILKAYATSPQGPRRIVFLLALDDGSLFFLFYRDKKDPVGANISPKNPAFASQLKKHLALLRTDLDSGAFDIIKSE
jgi:hypothetical protein